jgi:FtsP/CotA-like multicopper oxidase with cupredoxin domain
MKKLPTFLLLSFALSCAFAKAQQAENLNPDNLPVHEYTLTIKKETVNHAGKDVTGMTVNDSIPGPTLRFKEGEYAVIYVKNEMDVETSVHWHGILLPNFYDGVPYLTTPPIQPGTTFKYEFALIQSGTYWYHSHTMLQEQSGVYGSIVIEPKEKTLDYDRDFVVVLSDWTNQKPENVLRNLKRGNEWYNIRKKTTTPLNKVIARGALGAQLNFWKQRMETMDIADVYYPAFLSNGQSVQNYPDFAPGEKIRVRIINAAASSQFWLTFGGQDPLLVAADGLDVVPVVHNKTFIAVAETYDFIVTIPASGKVEIRAMAQDGSGHSSTYLGKGEPVPAPVVPKPDQIGMMKQMAAMKMRMGAPATKFNPSEEEPKQMMNDWGMKMDMGKGMKVDHAKTGHSMKGMKHRKGTEMSGDSMEMAEMNHGEMDHSKMDHSKMGDMSGMKTDTTQKMGGMNSDKMPGMEGMSMNGEDDMEMNDMKMPGMDMFAEYNYDYLKSPEKTTIPTDPDEEKPVRRIILNLTGNMWRYIWSMNGVPLSEADKIQIKKGEVVRITLNNLTMMHHPMHLHGHFFRVLNKNGEYSPLKHTVNVAPMEKTVIEFDAREYGDWFFHCHILYHMNSGMARVFSYGNARDPRLQGSPLARLTTESNHYFAWGVADVASQMTHLTGVVSNLRNQFNLRAEYGWNQRMETEITYERYLYDYFRVFGGINAENEKGETPGDATVTAVGGIRFLTPYMFNLDVRMDSKLRPQVSLSRSVMIFPRTVLFGEYEYQADFGWTKRPAREGVLDNGAYRKEVIWSAGLEYFLSRNISLMGSYDNRFGAGGGLSIRF